MKLALAAAILFAQGVCAQTSWVYQDLQLSVSNLAWSNTFSVSLSRNPDHPYLWYLATNSNGSRVEIPASGVITASVPDGWALRSYDGRFLVYWPTGSAVIVGTNPITFTYESRYRFATRYTNSDPSRVHSRAWIIGGGIHETNLNGRPIGAGYQQFPTLGPVVPSVAEIAPEGEAMRLLVADAYPGDLIVETLASNEWRVVTNVLAGSEVTNAAVQIPGEGAAIFRVRFPD